MDNCAKEIINPKNSGIVRAIFLYVGDGESTLLVVPNEEQYKYVLIDTNLDEEKDGIDIIRLLTDLLEKKLDVFINTHPHNDHLKGLKQIHETVGINEVWHSGHKPGKDHDVAYQEMCDVIKKIGKSNEFVLFGTNDLNKIRQSDRETEVIKKLGDMEYIILSPAKYVVDDIEGEIPEERYNRIHEQCSVIKFSYGAQSKRHILITGDSDRKAWEDNITNYHIARLPSDVLSASHHGSRSFFKEKEDSDDIYEAHIEAISPLYVVISAPKQEESRHKHPHADALELYQKYTPKENIVNLGENRECMIVDISNDGDIEVRFDQELVREYGLKASNKHSDSDSYKNIGIKTSRLDEQKMG
jgi:beta-lactamase superfamily II metal-dependent hydrolase